jgi:VWFA-related protein
MVRAAVLCAALVCPAVAVAAQQATNPGPAQGQQQPPPTFRSGVNLVAVDVSVVDRNSRPVDDLKPADFAIKVDGQARSIVSAEFVSFRHGDDGPAAPGAWFSSNVGQRPGRLIMIVVDESHIRRGTINAIIDAAVGYIDTLGRSDRVAVQIIPGAGPLVNFTADHALVKRVLRTAVGSTIEADRTAKVGISEAVEILERPGPSDQLLPHSTLMSVIERECPGDHDAASLDRCRREIEGLARSVHASARARAVAAMVGLREIVDRLAATPDPKTVVLITEGVLVGRNFADISWVPERTAAASVSLYGLRVENEELEASMRSRSPSRDADRDLLEDGLNLLVGMARGTVFPFGANPKVTFARLGLELSGYYLLSFQPGPSDSDGRPHKIAVSVSRPGVTVRARREFSTSETTTAKPIDARLVDLLRSPLLFADFGIHTATFTYRDAEAGRLKVLVSTQIDRTFNPTGDFALAYYVLDQEGKIIATQVEPSIGAPGPAGPGRPHHFTGSVTMPPGRYSLKVAVLDPQGRKASLEHAFEARLTAVGQLRLGELMLASAPAAGLAAKPSADGRIASDVVVGYTELYSDAEPQLRQATLAFEVAVTAEGRAIATTDMEISTSPNKRTALGSLPASLLSPGEYVARVVLSSNGRPIGQVTRPFVLAPSAGPAAVVVAAAPAATPPRALVSAAPVPFVAPIESFDRSAVLTRPVIGFFLGRLAQPGIPPAPESLTPALGLARSGRFAEAAQFVEKAGANHVAAPFLAGLAHLAQADLQNAAVSFGAALKLAPEFSPAAFYLGACFAADGRDRDALVAWRLVSDVDPDAPWIHTQIADALWRQHARQEALAAADLDRLLVAMRAIFEAREAGRALESPAVDRDRFGKYFEAYKTAGGPAIAAAEGWKRVVDR